MRHAIKVTVVISLSDTGEVQVGRPTVEALGEDGGLSAAVNAVFNAATAGGHVPPAAAAVVTTRQPTESEFNKAVLLSEQVKLPRNELDAALAAYTCVRVIEVLEWMRVKARAGELRSPAGLLWKVLGGR